MGRHEKVVAELLTGKGYEQMLPLYKTRRQWADRIKDLELPLFPGYVFCRFDARRRVPILNTAGVIDVVHTGRDLAPIDDDEILSLTIAMKSGFTCLPFPYVTLGELVTVAFGALAGATGTIVAIKQGRRLVLAVSMLNRSVLVDVDVDSLAPSELPRLCSAGAC
jgi:transcription antitermination factor NusG